MKLGVSLIGKLYLCICLVIGFSGEAYAAVCSRCGKDVIGGSLGMSTHICKPKRKKSTPIVVTYGSDKKEKEVSTPINSASQISRFELSSIKYPRVKYNNYFSFDKEMRSWTSRQNGRVVEGVWRICTEDCKFIYIENTESESFMKIYISSLVDKDKKYVEDRISELKKKEYVWWEGGFFSRADLKYIRKAEKMVLEQSSETLVDVPYKILKILDHGALASFGMSRSYGVNYSMGKTFFLAAELDGIITDSEQMRGKLFWASTYKYKNGFNQQRVVDRYTLSFPFAVFWVRTNLGLYDESSWDYELFKKMAEANNAKGVVNPTSPQNVSGPVLHSTGSGFFVTKNGYLVTNNHVVEGGRIYKVVTEKGTYEAKVVSVDPATDLALLKVEISVSPCRFSRRRTEKLGTEIFTMGFPMPGLQGFSPKVTKGIISGTSGFKGDVREYQIDATIQPGNSGGPLFDAVGNVVGVLVASLKNGQAVNYAIKKSYVMAFLDSIAECSAGLEESDDSSVVKLQLSDVISRVQNSCVLILNYK